MLVAGVSLLRQQGKLSAPSSIRDQLFRLLAFCSFPSIKTWPLPSSNTEWIRMKVPSRNSTLFFPGAAGSVDGGRGL